VPFRHGPRSDVSKYGADTGYSRGTASPIAQFNPRPKQVRSSLNPTIFRQFFGGGRVFGMGVHRLMTPCVCVRGRFATQLLILKPFRRGGLTYAIHWD
jgi:hypothetical protein